MVTGAGEASGLRWLKLDDENVARGGDRAGKRARTDENGDACRGGGARTPQSRPRRAGARRRPCGRTPCYKLTSGRGARTRLPCCGVWDMAEAAGPLWRTPGTPSRPQKCQCTLQARLARWRARTTATGEGGL